MREEPIKMDVRRGRYMVQEDDNFHVNKHNNYIPAEFIIPINSHSNPTKYLKYMRGMEIYEEVISKEEACNIVDNMFHICNNTKYIGEKYCMETAHNVLTKYKEHIPDNVSVEEVYIVINAQYHDYGTLFEKWFEEDVDKRIFETAIEFWFNDVDFDGDKVWKYFIEM